MNTAQKLRPEPSNDFDEVFGLDQIVKPLGKEIGREIVGNLIEGQLTATWQHTHRPLPWDCDAEITVLTHLLMPSVDRRVFDGLRAEDFYQPWHGRIAAELLKSEVTPTTDELVAALDLATPYAAARWHRLIEWIEVNAPAFGTDEQVRDVVQRVRRLAARRERVRRYDELTAELRNVDVDDNDELERLRGIAAILKGQPAR